MTGFILVTELHRNYQYNFFYIFQYLISNTSGYAMDKSLVIIHALIICK